MSKRSGGLWRSPSSTNANSQVTPGLGCSNALGFRFRVVAFSSARSTPAGKSGKLSAGTSDFSCDSVGIEGSAGVLRSGQ